MAQEVRGGNAGSSGVNNNSGAGGNSPNGGGIGGGSRNSDNNGVAGTAPGGGGSGANHVSGGTNSGGNGGRGEIRISYTPNPTSGCDPCTSIPISAFPYTYSGTTVGYSDFMTGSCTGNWTTSGAGNDVFFAVTVAANSYLEFQVTGTSTTQYTELSVLSAAACSGPWTCLTNGSWSGGLQTASYTLDATGNATAVNTAADSPCRIVWFQNAGTYYIRIDGNSTSNGPFTLNVDTYTPITTDGDACTNPTMMSADVDYTVSSTNCTFTMGSDDPTPASLYCAGSVENTNWFSFTTDGSGSNAVVDINGVSCTPGYAVQTGPFSYSIYGASGQFGIMTGTCGGAFSSVAGVPCASLSTAQTYNASLPNTTPTTYYFVWDGNGGAECTYTISVSNILPLPIKLSKFDVFEYKSSVYLNWITETEVNNDYFTIERSTDLKNYEIIEVVKGNGNSNTKINYNIVDKNPKIGTSYYRLKQTDYDGNFEYFEPVAVTIKNKLEDVVVYPNPVTGNSFLTFNSTQETTQTISIYDIASRVVYEKQYAVKRGENKLMLETTNLTKGMYFVRLADGAEGVNIKFIKE